MGRIDLPDPVRDEDFGWDFSDEFDEDGDEDE